MAVNPRVAASPYNLHPWATQDTNDVSGMGICVNVKTCPKSFTPEAWGRPSNNNDVPVG